jgi:hypothetical protein
MILQKKKISLRKKHLKTIVMSEHETPGPIIGITKEILNEHKNYYTMVEKTILGHNHSIDNIESQQITNKEEDARRNSVRKISKYLINPKKAIKNGNDNLEVKAML